MSADMDSVGMIKLLSNSVGASEPALRLLISTLLGYPLAYIFRKFVKGQSTFINHVFFTFTGLALCYFNYGYEIYHSVLAVLVTYLTIKIFSGKIHGVIFVFVFHMSYLLTGYYFTGTDTYDIKWTMPHCVLVLRLIGLVFDHYDGQQPFDTLSTETKKWALQSAPSLLEVAGHTYFPAGFLVGPQFPMKRYLRYAQGEFEKFDGSVSYGIRRLVMGLFYLTVNQIGSTWLTDDFLLSEQFQELSIIYRMLLIGIWGKMTLYKYISIWLISEGACCCFGLTYNEEKDDWTGCENIKLYIFENATKFGHYIESFNVNTNWWVSQYVYKRLKFMGNRYLSQGFTLLFLAVWHGFHSGYYMCFFMEFVVMFFEKEFEPILSRNKTAMDFLSSPFMQPILFVLLKLYTIVNMGYCLVPFAFLNVHRWWHVYSVVYFYGFIVFLPWPFIYKPIVKMILRPSNPKVD